MSQSLINKGRAAAYRLVIIQAVSVLLASLVALYWGSVTGLSVFAGGMISVISSLVFAYKAFQHTGAQASKQVMRAFYIGEALKFFLFITLLVMVFLWLPLSAAACLIGFVISVLIQLTAPLVVKTT